MSTTTMIPVGQREKGPAAPSGSPSAVPNNGSSSTTVNVVNQVRVETSVQSSVVALSVTLSVTVLVTITLVAYLVFRTRLRVCGLGGGSDSSTMGAEEAEARGGVDLYT